MLPCCCKTTDGGGGGVDVATPALLCGGGSWAPRTGHFLQPDGWVHQWPSARSSACLPLFRQSCSALYIKVWPWVTHPLLVVPSMQWANPFTEPFGRIPNCNHFVTTFCAAHAEYLTQASWSHGLSSDSKSSAPWFQAIPFSMPQFPHPWIS